MAFARCPLHELRRRSPSTSARIKSCFLSVSTFRNAGGPQRSRTPGPWAKGSPPRPVLLASRRRRSRPWRSPSSRPTAPPSGEYGRWANPVAGAGTAGSAEKADTPPRSDADSPTCRRPFARHTHARPRARYWRGPGRPVRAALNGSPCARAARRPIRAQATAGTASEPERTPCDVETMARPRPPRTRGISSLAR